MSRSKDIKVPEVPELVVDNENPSRRYVRGKFLGKGAYGRCWELKDSAGRICAGKAIGKALLTKKADKDKVGTFTRHMRTCAI